VAQDTTYQPAELLNHIELLPEFLAVESDRTGEFIEPA
jgi:hypothetical protein